MAVVVETLVSTVHVMHGRIGIEVQLVFPSTTTTAVGMDRDACLSLLLCSSRSSCSSRGGQLLDDVFGSVGHGNVPRIEGCHSVPTRGGGRGTACCSHGNSSMNDIVVCRCLLYKVTLRTRNWI